MRWLPKKGKAGKKDPKLSVEGSLVQTVALCLLAFGVVMVFSASSTTSLLGEIGDGAYFLKRTLIFGALGLIAMRILSRRGLSFIRGVTPLFLLVSIGLLVVTMAIGTDVNGARRWLVLGPMQIQASELAKVALLMYSAHLLTQRPHLVNSIRDMVPLLAVAGCICLLIVIEPDLGTAIVAAMALAALLIAAGARLRHLTAVAAVLVAFAGIAVMAEPYRQERLLGFINPSADAEGAGFQTNQAQIALGSGGVLGVGLGESVQKAFYLPEAHTDMIGAVVGEELGLAGFAALIVLYGLFAYGALRVAQRAKDRYGQLLVAALVAGIMVQAIVNLFAVLGLAPLTGVPLPLVSYGNSSLIVTLASVGLIMNVAAGGTARRKGDASVRAERGTGRKGARGRLRLLEGGRSAAPAKRRTAKRGTSTGGTRRDRGRRNGGARRSRSGRRRRASG